MQLRIVVAAIGGLLGFAIWYIAVASMGLASFATQVMHSNGVMYFYGSAGLCAFGGGGLALLVGEKLRLIPTQERMNEEARPPSILSRGED